MHPQYRCWESLRCIPDRKDCTPGQLEKMDVTDHLHQHYPFSPHHSHALLRTMPTGQSAVGPQIDQIRYWKVLESHTGEYVSGFSDKLPALSSQIDVWKHHPRQYPDFTVCFSKIRGVL